MATAKDFYLGARPKTLSAAIAPVSIGAALAYYENSDDFDFGVSFACLIVAIALQIGVNYANDYSDGKKGTDDNRVGPMRLVGSGRASAKSVFVAMCVSFFIAGLAGVYVASQSSWWLILVGLICIALAWFYTGGKHPYGYYGLGEIVVFVCFGLVATVGTFYANTGVITFNSIISGCIPGFYSVAILLANNIRDIETDRESGKRTLASRIGDRYSRNLFAFVFVMIAISIILLSVSIGYVWFALSVLVIGVILVKKMYGAKKPPEYISILVGTSQANLISGLLISAMILLSAS